MNFKNFLIGVLCCMFSVALFAAPQKKPEYKFDFDAPREEVIVTKAICVQVGFAARGIKVGINNGLSNATIKARLYKSTVENLDDRDGVVSVTIMINIIDSVRDWQTQPDFIRLANANQNMGTLDLIQVLGEMRCESFFLGKPVSIAKIVRVK